MADPVDDQSAQPAAAPASIPSTETQASAAPVIADQVAATSAPAVDTSPAAGAEPSPAPAATEPEPTLLEKFDAEKAKTAEGEKKPDATIEAKPADAKPAETVKAPDAKPVEAAKPEPIDYFKDVTIPETIKVDDAQRGDVTKALDSIRAGKVSDGVQQLFALHETTMKDYAEQLRRDQWTAFNKTNQDWKNAVMGDPVLGGAGHNTAMGAIARMRDLAVSDAKPGSDEYKADVKEFETFLRVTGAGNHPAFLRMLHNFARYFDEPPLPPEGIRPPLNIGRQPGDRRGRMYPSMNGTGR